MRNPASEAIKSTLLKGRFSISETMKIVANTMLGLIIVALKNFRTVHDMVSLIFVKWDVEIHIGKNWSILP